MAATFLQVEVEGLWAPYRRGVWIHHDDEPRFMVFDEQRGIQIAAIDRGSGDWIADDGRPG